MKYRLPILIFALAAVASGEPTRPAKPAPVVLPPSIEIRSASPEPAEGEAPAKDSGVIELPPINGAKAPKMSGRSYWRGMSPYGLPQVPGRGGPDGSSPNGPMPNGGGLMPGGIPTYR